MSNVFIHDSFNYALYASGYIGYDRIMNNKLGKDLEGSDRCLLGRTKETTINLI
jgi:hypothetical protein